MKFVKNYVFLQQTKIFSLFIKRLTVAENIHTKFILI